MKRFLFACAVILSLMLVLALARPASAQTATDIPVSVDALEGLCQKVAKAQIRGETDLDGKCIGGTGGFLEMVKRTAPDTLEDVVTEVVTRLATLILEEKDCPAYETEIPQAIRLASTFSEDPEQVTRIVGIAESIETCAFGDTQAIDDGPDVASDIGG